MTWPHRKLPAPTLADFAAARPLAEVDASIKALVAWNAQLTRPGAEPPRKADDRPEPTLNITGDGS